MITDWRRVWGIRKDPRGYLALPCARRATSTEQQGEGGPPLAMRCSGITRSGTRCERSADGPNGLCWLHDPANAEKRRRLASQAGRAKPGRAKPGRELSEIKQRLSDLADDVLEGNVERGTGAVASQILNVYLRAVSVERS
jgi:hypothetical protein